MHYHHDEAPEPDGPLSAMMSGNTKVVVLQSGNFTKMTQYMNDDIVNISGRHARSCRNSLAYFSKYNIRHGLIV